LSVGAAATQPECAAHTSDSAHATLSACDDDLASTKAGGPDGKNPDGIATVFASLSRLPAAASTSSAAARAALKVVTTAAATAGSA